MAEPPVVTIYIDYKSPYAYLAKDPAYELGRDFGVRLDWLPYTLDIPSYLGSARLDDRGDVVESERSPHQWRRVRYSYMDCRRQARKRGLVIRGTQKIWDSTLAAAGMLYAKRQSADVLHHYIDIAFERFWKRELDIEDPVVIASVFAEAVGLQPTDLIRGESRSPSVPARDSGGVGPGLRGDCEGGSLSADHSASTTASSGAQPAQTSPPRANAAAVPGR